VLKGECREEFKPEDPNENQFPHWAFGRSVSTYPLTDKANNKHQGDPICDAYCYKRYGNR
jgi:hypothetical protein